MYAALDLGLDAVTSNLLRNCLTYPWADTGISYLGITLTKSTRGLCANNYTEAKQMLTRETAKLSKHELMVRTTGSIQDVSPAQIALSIPNIVAATFTLIPLSPIHPKPLRVAREKTQEQPHKTYYKTYKTY